MILVNHKMYEIYISSKLLSVVGGIQNESESILMPK